MKDKNLKKLRLYIERHGLKWSRQRQVIVDVFCEAQEHLRVEQLLEKARLVDPRISQATVYRTMRLLVDSGLAVARNFGDTHTLYEPKGDEGGHHDHLICTECGKIVEFTNDQIESLQDAVAGQHGFKVTEHKLELYGVCAACIKSAD